MSAIVIEDKIGLKKNSLFGQKVKQTQDNIERFSAKIHGGKIVQVTEDFMIIARIESLVLGAGMNDALARAKAYIEVGADGIMIHSRHRNPAEIFEFCDQYTQFPRRVPLMVVPSSYHIVNENELAKKGVNIVVYANRLLRSAYPPMIRAAKSILIHGRSHEIDSQLLPIDQTLQLFEESK